MLSWTKTASVQFELSHAEMKSAMKKFKAGTGDDPAIFNKVQRALVDLEDKASRYSTASSAHTETRRV